MALLLPLGSYLSHSSNYYSTSIFLIIYYFSYLKVKIHMMDRLLRWDEQEVGTLN